MSYSLVFPCDFESLFDKLVTDRYGPPDAAGSNDRKSWVSTTPGSRQVSQLIRPKMDVVEHDSSFIITAELPGAKKEDISIDLQDGRLSISGQTKSSNEHSEANVRVSERTFGTFTRTIAVPQSVTPEQIKAAFTDGVLQVTVPKPKNSQAKSIAIS